MHKNIKEDPRFRNLANSLIKGGTVERDAALAHIVYVEKSLANTLRRNTQSASNPSTDGTLIKPRF